MSSPARGYRPRFPWAELLSAFSLEHSGCGVPQERRTKEKILGNGCISSAMDAFTILTMRIIIRSSAIHAAGVFTLERIPKGTLIVEYTGTRMKHDDADDLYRDRPYTYLFGVGDGTYVVDGFSMAMYLNHSCEPNCETEEDEEEHVWIRAFRDIEAGEELVYDYFLYDGEGEAPCTCGAPRCRGTMYSPKELRKRQRTARKQAGEKKATRKTN